MKRHSCLSVCALLLVAYFPTQVWAGSELFPSTEVTVRYEPWQWVMKTYHHYTAPAVQTSAAINTMANIEPAEGPEEQKAGEHGEAKPTEADTTPVARGKSEGQKSFSGKTVGAPPALPKVTIGGVAVITRAASVAADISETTPAGLKAPGFSDFLERRFNITPYAHSPILGDPKAPIRVIEFIDLSCGQCMPELTKIDAALHDYASSTVVIHIHAPTARFQDTNMPAFYGKIAARSNVFWTYRDNIIKDKPADGNAIFDELVKSGVSVQDARTMMLNEARRFYRELDADSLLARSFGVGKPPVLFVNGIRLGESGLPLDKLPDVLEYVNARIQHGLSEPPK